MSRRNRYSVAYCGTVDRPWSVVDTLARQTVMSFATVTPARKRARELNRQLREGFGR